MKSKFSAISVFTFVCFLANTTICANLADEERLSDHHRPKALVIDGGGARAICPAVMLINMERALEGKKIADVFTSGITGTSAGAIIAAALTVKRHRIMPDEENPAELDNYPDWATGPYTAKQVKGIYLKLAEAIFTDYYCDSTCCSALYYCCTPVRWLLNCCGLPNNCRTSCDGWCGPKYKNSALKERLEYYFGDLTIGDTYKKTPLQVVTFDLATNVPRYISNLDEGEKNISMVNAILASTAAPTYFSAVKIDFANNNDLDSDYWGCVDGGMHGNSSPFAARLLALDLLLQTNPLAREKDLDDLVLVSLGTGIERKPELFSRLKNAGKISWAEPAIDIAIDGATAAKESIIDKLMNLPGSTKRKSYFRFQVILPKLTELDEWRSMGDLANETSQMMGKRKDDSDYQNFVKSFLDPLAEDVIASEEDHSAISIEDEEAVMFSAMVKDSSPLFKPVLPGAAGYGSGDEDGADEEE